MTLRPKLLFLLSGMVLCMAQSALAFDYSLGVAGSRIVTQGYSMAFQVRPTLISGTDEQAYVQISGLPAGATATWWTLKLHCCGNFAWSLNTNQPIQVQTTPTTPIGTYPVTITYTTFSGVSRSTSFNLQVVPVPIAPVPTLTSAPLASEDQWRTNMRTYGLQHCNSTDADISSETHAWYYDGNRVYSQIAAYLSDSSFLSCADMFNTTYRNYVLSTNGGIPSWRVFPHGLTSNFQRTGASASRDAVLAMADASGWTSEQVANEYPLDITNTRDGAYAIDTLLAAERLGRPRTWKLPFLVDSMLSLFEQFFSQRTATPQPFMIALAAEALIDWYEVTGDPRILPALRLAADRLWADSWDPASQSFLYVEFSNGTREPAGDLNLLIAPLYGWVYSKTGDPVYRNNGDTAFNAGVAYAWITGGKQFSQNYRWSEKYVAWRQTSNCSWTLGSASATVSAAGGPGTVSVSSSTGCAWSATTDSSWITITSAAAGSGSGSISYSIPANTSTTPRVGVIAIAGASFTITQAAAAIPVVPCTFSVSSTVASLGAQASSSSVDLTTGNGCSWTVTSDASWLTAAASAGSGPATIPFTATANPTSTSRVGHLVIGNFMVTITQTGAINVVQTCSYTLSQTTDSTSALPSVRSVQVTTEPGCSWTATSNVPWIAVSPTATITGSASLTYIVAPNMGITARTGLIKIADKTLTINQARK